mmetsp:Transcript_24064/g.46949  ORF Transcript_24064/g.46949 Transcript_24064/m.46949 type:complete len:628 (+) Transcript_24064:161-2044(+)
MLLFRNQLSLQQEVEFICESLKKAGIPVLAKGGLEKRSDIYVALNQSLGLKLRGWGRGWLLELKVLKGAASKNASPELWSKTMSKNFEAPFASMKPSQRLKILCDSLEASRSKKGVEQCYELVSTMSPEELSEACIVTAKARTPIFTAKCCLEIADVDLSSAFGGDGSADAKSPSQVRRFRTISVEGGNTNMAVETVINLLKTRGVEDVFIGGYPGFIVHTNKTRKTKASPEQEKSRSKLISELVSLLESQLAKGIDYRKLGLGWDHPETRLAYRQEAHISITSSRERQAAELADLKKKMVESKTAAESAAMLVKSFCSAIGGSPKGANPTVDGVMLALRHELLNPLRALNEGRKYMEKTFNGQSVPRQHIDRAVDDIVRAVLEGKFKEWRYSNPVGNRQLEGLSDDQLKEWARAGCMKHTENVTTIEGDETELSFFWATKIGGPSHGFDFEAQCILPLLANARSKVILVNDPVSWPHYPAGRAHFKLLWTKSDGIDKPLLWLETLNLDFGFGYDRSGKWLGFVIEHAVRKADAMGIILSVSRGMQNLLLEASKGRGTVKTTQHRVILRPSNGVMEASDYLSEKHDWVQIKEEITPAMSRVVYIPSGKSAEVVHIPSEKSAEKKQCL